MKDILLPIGKIMASDSVFYLMESNTDFKKFAEWCLNRYVLCDWGNTSSVDWKKNDEAVVNGDRVMAVYFIPDDIENTFEDQLWFITEPDRSETRIIFQSDY